MTVLAVASRALSAHALAWCLCRNQNPRASNIFIATMTPIAAWALLSGTTVPLLPTTPKGAAVAIFAGFLTGGATILAEWISAHRDTRVSYAVAAELDLDEMLLKDSLTRDAPGIARIYRNWNTKQRATVTRPWNLAELISVGLLEEVLYRGVVVFIALQLESCLLIACLLGTSALFFGASHHTFGSRQVILKTGFGIAAAVLTFALQDLTSAIISHVVLNTYSWRETRRWMQNLKAQQGA